MFDEEGAERGIMTVKIMIYQIFSMSNHVVTALNILLDNFANYGLTTVQGKNMVLELSRFQLLVEIWHS